MAASKLKAVSTKKKAVNKAALTAAAAKPAAKPVAKPAAKRAGGARKAGSTPAKKTRLWMVPVGMMAVLVAVGAFLFIHASYLASLKFDMVRTARVVPQGRDQGQGTQLVNLAGDKQGDMFMLESEQAGRVRLQRFDVQNSPATLVYTPTRPGQDITAAIDVDCDPQGLVYVLLRDGRVQVLSNDLKYLRTIPTGVFSGAAVAVNSAGRVYVADNANNKVVYFDPTGRKAGEFGGTGANEGDTQLAAPILMRVTPDDGLFVVENTATGMRGRIFDKSLLLRKTFLVDKIGTSPWVRMGVNSQDKVFFNDQAGTTGIDCWDLADGKFVGASQATKDGVKFDSPGCIGANRYTPDVYVHTIPGLVKCVLPVPGAGGGQ